MFLPRESPGTEESSGPRSMESQKSRTWLSDWEHMQNRAGVLHAFLRESHTPVMVAHFLWSLATTNLNFVHPSHHNLAPGTASSPPFSLWPFICKRSQTSTTEPKPFPDISTGRDQGPQLPQPLCCQGSRSFLGEINHSVNFKIYLETLAFMNPSCN